MFVAARRSNISWTQRAPSAVAHEAAIIICYRERGDFLQTATGEQDMPLWTWHALGWLATSQLSISCSVCDKTVLGCCGRESEEVLIHYDVSTILWTLAGGLRWKAGVVIAAMSLNRHTPIPPIAPTPPSLDEETQWTQRIQRLKETENYTDEVCELCSTLVDFWVTAFSLPGQFAPWIGSSNRTLANSLPGTFVPWNLWCL